MTLLIEQKLDDVIWKIRSRRRPDSNELPNFMKGMDREATKEAIAETLDFRHGLIVY